MIKGAIFDMDGTLLDSMPVWEHASEQYLKKRGILARENLSEVLFSMSMHQGATYVKVNYGLPESTEEIVEGVNAIVFDAYQNKVRQKPGVELFLELLKQDGVKMAVATSTDRPMAEAGLKRTGLAPYFEQIFTCTEIGAGKSKPDIYLAAAEFLGTTKQETWVFEDALYAIRTAGREGFKTVGIYDAASLRDQMAVKESADYYIRDFGGGQSILEKLRKWG